MSKSLRDHLFGDFRFCVPSKMHVGSWTIHTEHKGPGVTIFFWKHLLLIKKMTLSQLRGLVWGACVWKTVCKARVSLRGMWDTRQEKHTSRVLTWDLSPGPVTRQELEAPTGLPQNLDPPHPGGPAVLRVKHCLHEQVWRLQSAGFYMMKTFDCMFICFRNWTTSTCRGIFLCWLDGSHWVKTWQVGDVIHSSCRCPFNSDGDFVARGKI